VSKTLLSAFLSILSLSVQGASILNTPPFNCEMTQATAPSSPAEFVFSVRNQLNEDVHLLSWYTPLEGPMSDLFIITNAAGMTLPYQGMMVKRGTPQEEDYIIISGGETVKVNIDLGAAYPFAKGEYQIKLKPGMWQYRLDGEGFSTECGMKALTVRGLW
jgi:hypothetical protein